MGLDLLIALVLVVGYRMRESTTIYVYGGSMVSGSAGVLDSYDGVISCEVGFSGSIGSLASDAHESAQLSTSVDSGDGVGVWNVGFCNYGKIGSAASDLSKSTLSTMILWR